MTQWFVGFHHHHIFTETHITYFKIKIKLEHILQHHTKKKNSFRGILIQCSVTYNGQVKYYDHKFTLGYITTVFHLLGIYFNRKEMFYLTMHSTHFIYRYMALDIL